MRVLRTVRSGSSGALHHSGRRAAHQCPPAPTSAPLCRCHQPSAHRSKRPSVPPDCTRHTGWAIALSLEAGLRPGRTLSLPLDSNHLPSNRCPYQPQHQGSKGVCGVRTLAQAHTQAIHKPVRVVSGKSPSSGPLSLIAGDRSRSDSPLLQWRSPVLCTGSAQIFVPCTEATCLSSADRSRSCLEPPKHPWCSQSLRAPAWSQT